jgi:hypothetical protein
LIIIYGFVGGDGSVYWLTSLIQIRNTKIFASPEEKSIRSSDVYEEKSPLGSTAASAVFLKLILEWHISSRNGYL